jgi:CDP-diacylglycerol--glycerol-3-phosphate 3-phosphatidyltransferase
MSERQLQLHHEPGLWPPTWPMGLTMLRLLLLPVFLYVLLKDANTPGHRYRWLAVVIFGVMAITDKLDGYLARKLNQTSKMGMLLDPLADKLLIVSSVLVLSFEWAAPSGYTIPWYVGLIVYAKDVVVAAGSLALLSLIGRVTITPRLLGKAATVVQLSMVIATLIGPDIQRLSSALAHGFTRGLWIATAAITSAAAIDYFVQGCRQFSQSKKGHGTTDEHR